MPRKLSAGLLMYRGSLSSPEVFLVHPGGPYWAKKDEGAWSLPKGEYASGDDALAAAQREFEEETGFETQGPFTELTAIRQPSGKTIRAWAFEGDCDPAALKSNTFSMEWPPRSGRRQEFPEVDRAAWFNLEEAKRRISPGQVGFLSELATRLGQF
jgi:predicted NUDIX family NTP pyrophosphohydrolase